MDHLQQGILTLIRSTIEGKGYALPEQLDMEEAQTYIFRHQISTLAYQGAVCCGVDKSLPVMQKLFYTYLRHLARSERQMAAVEQLSSAFEAAEIDHLLLKGSRLKSLYPKPELRIMGDADILIRQAQYDRIKPLMVQLGYEEKEVGPYDYTWNAADLHVELHYRLASPADTDFLRYFGDGWQRAHQEEGRSHRYVYRTEDELIYLFMHFAKHYRDGGIGLRHAVDLYLFRRRYSDLDMAYVERELRCLHLWLFYQNTCTMLDSWFSDLEADEKSAYMTDVIFRSGAFGTAESYRASVGVRAAKQSGGTEKAKRWQMLQLAFPSREVMQVRYPIVEKLPFLLPFCWILRGFRVLFFERDKLETQKKSLMVITPDKIETYQQALQYVGLDFNFEE